MNDANDVLDRAEKWIGSPVPSTLEASLDDNEKAYAVIKDLVTEVKRLYGILYAVKKAVE